MNDRTTFQCFTCQSRTKFGGFNEADRYECWFCFKERQRTAKPASGKRQSPTLYMRRQDLTDDAILTGLRDRIRSK